MKATKAEIVTHDQGVIEVKIEHLVTACALRGWTMKGVKRSLSIKLAEEIEGQPVFDKLVGPMYGGEGIVRYETGPVNDVLSK